MSLEIHRVYKNQMYPVFYYDYSVADKYLDDRVWVMLIVDRAHENFVMFGIKDGVPHSKKFNNRVRRIVKALINHPFAFELPTLISVKDINENLQTILDFINKETQ